MQDGLGCFCIHFVSFKMGLKARRREKKPGMVRSFQIRNKRNGYIKLLAFRPFTPLEPVSLNISPTRQPLIVPITAHLTFLPLLTFVSYLRTHGIALSCINQPPRILSSNPIHRKGEDRKERHRFSVTCWGWGERGCGVRIPPNSENILSLEKKSGSLSLM